jgi:DNA-binding CsgD family transcriptional regulator
VQRYELTGISEIYVEERQALLEVGQGDHDAAAERIARVRPLTERAVEAQLITPLTEAAAELALWRGRPEDARQEVAAALGRLPMQEEGYTSRVAPVLALGVRAEAECHAIRGLRPPGIDDEGSLEIAMRYLDVMTALRETAHERRLMFADEADAWLSLCRAEQTRLEDRPTSAAWATAANAFGALSMAYPRAYSLWRQAEAELAASRSRSSAAEPLRAANAIATELGAEPLRSAIAALATAAHLDLAVPGTPRTGREVSGPGDGLGLTQREREVLRLLAAGRTNREIADELFITEGTAGTHVSNILGKLGVRTRTEAAAIAHRLSLAG